MSPGWGVSEPGIGVSESGLGGTSPDWGSVSPGWEERALPSLKPHSRAPIPHPSRAAGSGLDGFSRILTQPPLPNSPRGPRPAEQLGREGISHRGEASLQLSRALPGGGGDALESRGRLVAGHSSPR